MGHDVRITYDIPIREKRMNECIILDYVMIRK